jgi:WhiB family redox-sensing transcriptional regulator
MIDLLEGVEIVARTPLANQFTDGTQPCRINPESFFPHKGSGQDIITARRLCASCPFTTPCLVWAVRRAEQGVWAGTTEQERKAIRRELRRRGVGGLATAGRGVAE